MSDPNLDDPLYLECRAMADRAKAASRLLALAGGQKQDEFLFVSQVHIQENAAEILEANSHDVAAARESGLSNAAIERLMLNTASLEAISRSLAQLARLPSPIGEVVRSSRRPNGLEVQQIRVPLGVIFMIYESRPNVTVDAAALCIKSGNAVILRGGKEAIHTNRALHQALCKAAETVNLPADAIQLVQTTDREAVGHLLRMPDRIDLAIPRGGESLIRRVVAEAQMPVLKHYAGNCHVYIDRSADEKMAVLITVNSKVQRPGVCNAAETVLVHRESARQILPKLAEELASRGVELRGDEAARAIVPAMKPASALDWDTEYLNLILAVKIVDSIDAAIAHINYHGTGHTEAIVTNDLEASRRFAAEVDSSAVMVNASTRFNDGGELGLGAEIGISTDKIHARGPCGLQELTTTKWIVHGQGHVRK